MKPLEVTLRMEVLERFKELLAALDDLAADAGR